MESSDTAEPASPADAVTRLSLPYGVPDQVDTRAPQPVPGSSDLPASDAAALDNARRGTWVVNDYLDGWMLMGANGRPVMRADGSRVAFWFRDLDRLAQELAAVGGASPATKPRAGLAKLDSGFDRDWDPGTRRAYFADVTKAARLLAYHYVQTTEPEEAVRRAVATVLGDPVTVSEGNISAFAPKRHHLAAVKVANAFRDELVGTENAGTPESNVGLDTARMKDGPPDTARQSRSEAEDIANVYRAAGSKFRHGRSTGGGNSIFDLIVDIEKGVIGGARDAAQEVIEGIDSLAGLIGLDPKLSEHLALPETWETKTAGGDVARSVSQFLVGFLPAFKAIKFASGGAALTKAGKFAQAEGAAAVASAMVLDPLEDRLSNTWQELGLPQNILTDYLAANPDDSESEGRLKNAIESLALGSVLAGGLALSAKILRAARRAITPKTAAAGAVVGTAFAADENTKTDAASEGGIEREALQNSESEPLSPYAGGAASAVAFAGSNLSVKAGPLRKAWEEKWGVPWPVDKNGRLYDVHHKKALQDGGTNDVGNIMPMQHDDHMRHHKENGDYSRWAKQSWARRKAAIAEAAANTIDGVKAVGSLVTKVAMRGKLKTD